jgi:hypothetical protein
MTFVMVDYHGHCEQLRDLAEAGEMFDDQAGSILPHGSPGQTIWFGPTDGAPVLRVDIDVDADLAALRWLPDGFHAVHWKPTAAITVLDSADGGLITIPADLACVDATTAKAAVLDYLTNGTRPSTVGWAGNLEVA